MSSMRTLDPFIAFLFSAVGLGFLYVGELSLGIAVVLSFLLAHAALGWTRIIFQPIGVYLVLASMLLMIAFSWVLPTLIAWRKKATSPKWYNRWYFYVTWTIGMSMFLGFWGIHNHQLSGFRILRAPSNGMAPGLEQGDWTVADTWHYREHAPRVGETVAIRDGDLMFTKRIVGLPGDTLEIRNGVVYRNGLREEEPYLHAPLDDKPYLRDVSPIKLGPNQFYVLGDFRDQSIDSRKYGPITPKDIFGRMELLCFSFQNSRIRWNRFPRDLTNDV